MILSNWRTDRFVVSSIKPSEFATFLAFAVFVEEDAAGLAGFDGL